MLSNALRGGGCQFFRKKCYEGVWFNVISVTRGSNFQKKVLRTGVTLEWPLAWGGSKRWTFIRNDGLL